MDGHAYGKIGTCKQQQGKEPLGRKLALIPQRTFNVIFNENIMQNYCEFSNFGFKTRFTT